jgi:hypothetical protein
MASLPLEMRMLGPALKKYDSSLLFSGANWFRSGVQRSTTANSVQEQARAPNFFFNLAQAPSLGVWSTTNLGKYQQKDVVMTKTSKFDGKWKFDSKRSDPPDEQLVYLGVPWWKRVLARQAKPTITIKHESERVWKQKINFPLIGTFYSLDETLPLDGTCQNSKLHGYDLECRSSEENDEVVTKTCLDGKTEGEIRRKIIDDGNTYFVVSRIYKEDGTTVDKKSYFTKV